MITIIIRKKGQSDISKLMQRLQAHRDKIEETEEDFKKSMDYVLYGIMINELYEVIDEMAVERLAKKWEKRKHFPYNFIDWTQRHVRKILKAWQKAST